MRWRAITTPGSDPGASAGVMTPSVSTSPGFDPAGRGCAGLAVAVEQLLDGKSSSPQSPTAAATGSARGREAGSGLSATHRLWTQPQPVFGGHGRRHLQLEHVTPGQPDLHQCAMVVGLEDRHDPGGQSPRSPVPKCASGSTKKAKRKVPPGMTDFGPPIPAPGWRRTRWSRWRAGRGWSGG